MNGSLYTGISGLQSHQRALDVESNNIANVNTVAFKSDRISFADMMYQRGVGKGTENTQVFKSHDQGTLKHTGNQYDFAIMGDGYFTLKDPQDPGVNYYSRAGNFKMSADGILRTADGKSVLGVKPTITGDKISKEYSNYIATAVFIIENKTVKTINVFSTDYKNTLVETGTSGDNLKTKSSNLNDIDTLSSTYNAAIKLYAKNPIPGDTPAYQKTSITYPKTLSSDNNYDLSVKINGLVYNQSFKDSMENSLKLFSDKLSAIPGVTTSVDTATGKLTIDSMIAGKKVNITNAKLNGTEYLISEDVAAKGSGKALVDELFTKLENLITTNGGKVIQNSSSITKPENNTTPTVDELQLNMDVLGISENVFGDLTIEDEYLFLNDGDAKYLVGQIPTIFFNNARGLDPKGDNSYKATKESGTPTYIEGKGKIESKMLELSTSDLSESLVNLMVFQKSYEANSKSITTSDEFLKTAIQLKR